MISILIGPNDFCFNFCHTNNPEKTVEYHEKHLVTALRTLRDNLPRTIVNLVTPPSMWLNVKLSANFRYFVYNPFRCKSTY